MVIEKAMISRKRSLVQSVPVTAPATAAAAVAVPLPKTSTKKKTIVKIASRLPHRLSSMNNSSNSNNKKKKSSSTKAATPKQPEVTLQQSLMNILVGQLGVVNAKILRFDMLVNTPTQTYFEEPKQFEIEAYGFEALEAVRKRDMEKLQQFHKEGRPLKCSNRFGESILHLACRKGFADVVDFLLNTAQVPVWVKDDFGRNPLHDACWTVEPNFELMDILIGKAPDLLLISDARGHTPLSYVRREHWDVWINYLNGKGEALKPITLKF